MKKRIAFKTNARRMGFRELFRVAGSPGMGFFACTLKLFRLIGPDSGGFGLRAFGNRLDRQDLDELPRRAIRACAGYRAKVEKLGFVRGFAYSVEAFGSQEGHAMVFRHRDGSAAVAIIYCRQVRNDAETESTVFGYNTPLSDDTFVMTSGNKRLMKKPSHFRVEYHPGKSPQEVFERHLERVDRGDARPLRVKSDDDLEQLVLDCENAETEFNLDRGVYVKMSRDEIELGEELRDEYEAEADSVGFRRRRRDDDD
jgi:hypothetical protein